LHLSLESTEYYVADSPNDLVVIANLYNDKNTIELLKSILMQYMQEEQEVMLFLHRNNYYESDTITQLLNDGSLTALKKCFLFAFGRDHIYYNNDKNTGLLDQAGGFKIDKAKGIITFDKKESKVLKSYFNEVWNYYKHEFYDKIMELMDDFFTFCMPYQKKEGNINKNEFLASIKGSDKYLYIRLRSFLDDFKKPVYQDNSNDDESQEYLEYIESVDKFNKEKEAFEEFEKKALKSYILDDFLANLKATHDGSNAIPSYKELKRQLTPICLEQSEGDEFDMDNFININKLFNELLESLPRELD
jgi:hypothetical protein